MDKKDIVYIDADIEALIPEFLDLKIKSFSEIRDLLKADDFDSIKEITHKMIGSWGTYGFSDLSELAAQMEEKIIAQDVDTFRKLLVEMEGYLENVEIVYQ